jgi:hypothetical protein
MQKKWLTYISQHCHNTYMPNPLNSPVQKYALQNLDIITNKHNEGNKLQSCRDFRQTVNWLGNPFWLQLIFY